MESRSFTPFTIRGHTLRNRFIFAPLATQYADNYGNVSDMMVDYYVHMTLTGVAVIVVEAACVTPEGRGWTRQLLTGAPDAVSGLSRLADAIRERGAIPILQIHHAGRQGLPTEKAGYVSAPSPVPCPILQRPTRELTLDEIRLLVVKFTDAARIAARAGFAGVELHGAHGYLLHQFVSPLTNHRIDEYGLHAGFRFPLEVVRSIKAAAPELMLWYRMSVRDYLPMGLTLETSVPFARALADAGVDLIHVSGGMYASLHGPESIVGKASPYGVFRDDARDIREAVPIPVAVVGKIQNPSLAESILANEDAHLIALGRVLIRDHQWLDKARRKKTVRSCLLCHRCKFHIQGCPDDTDGPPWIR